MMSVFPTGCKKKIRVTSQGKLKNGSNSLFLNEHPNITSLFLYWHSKGDSNIKQCDFLCVNECIQEEKRKTIKTDLLKKKKKAYKTAGDQKAIF